MMAIIVVTSMTLRQLEPHGIADIISCGFSLIQNKKNNGSLPNYLPQKPLNAELVIYIE